MKYLSDKYYTEPPQSKEALDFRVREIKARPGGERTLKDYADLAKTDPKAVSQSWSRLDKEGW